MNLKPLSRLPKLDEVWIADRRASSMVVADLGPLDLILWMDPKGRIRSSNPVPRAAGPDVWVAAFVAAAESPVPGTAAGVPAQLLVCDAAALPHLGPALKPLGIPVTQSASAVALDEAFRSVEAALGGGPRHQSYMEVISGPLPRKKKAVADFYTEAERLYRAAPWLSADEVTLLRLHGLAEKPVLVSVLGAGGRERGLEVFGSDRSALLALAGKDLTGELALQVSFEPAEAMPGLLKEARKAGLPLAEDGLVPVAVADDGSTRPLSVDELELLTQASRVARLHFAGEALPEGITAEWPAKLPGRKPARPADLYQLRIELDGTQVWRQILVPSDCTLADLHVVIQEAMGWEDCHLYEFRTKEASYGPEELEQPTPPCDEVLISEVLKRVRGRLTYRYDFGDDWVHDLVLEKRIPPGPGVLEFDLLDGALACPPEDCGGPGGYAELVEALADRKHPDRADWLERVGRYDPNKFNLAKRRKLVRDLAGEGPSEADG